MPQPLLSARTSSQRVVIAVIIPAVYGLITGLMLGISAGVYLLLSLLGILGGLAAGYDHSDANEGALRGICGGMLFGTFILLGGTLIGKEAKASIPDPQWTLPVITTVLGAIFGAIGASLRGRYERREISEAGARTRTSG
jgi:4-hydroxybenzoate polyprenyltransferase